MRFEGCDEPDRLLYGEAQLFGVRGDAPDAVRREGAARGFQVGDALVEAVNNDRFHGVQLELAPLPPRW